MKSLKLNLALCLLFCITSSSLFSQDFQGVAYYQTKTTIDLDNWGRGQMSEQQKKMIMDRMKSALEKTFVLTFNRSESSYKEEEQLEAPGQGRGGFGAFMSSFTGGAQYKNVKDQELLQEQEFFGKQFLIKDELKALEWKMGSETKKIGQYTCFKATAKKTVDEFDWRSMRRRGREEDNKEKTADSTKTTDPMDEIEVPKEIEVVAWYTLDIPVNQGPGEYWGLPGLILEVNADRTTILCSKIVLNPKEKGEIKKPSKGKQVTKQEYNDIMKKKVEEMRQMYGGRGRGRGNFRRN